MKMKPAIRTMLTYALLGPPIGAVTVLLIFVPSEVINSGLSQFKSLLEELVEMFMTLCLSLIFSFWLGLVPALLAGFTHLILQDRLHLQRAAIVCAVTGMGLVSTIVFRASLSHFDAGWESVETILVLLLPPLASSLTISLYLTRRTGNAT